MTFIMINNYNVVFYIADTPTDLDGNGTLDTGWVCSSADINTGVSNWYNAIDICADYTVTSGGIVYDDWRLPSTGVLNWLYLKRSNVNITNTMWYWSSTTSTAWDGNGLAWEQHFDDGVRQTYFKSEAYNAVRAVRAF